jgi:hypothetical protein
METQRAMKQDLGNAKPTSVEVMRAVLDFYIASSDFNGLPASSLFKDDREREIIRSVLSQLLVEQKISIEFSAFSANPHIKSFPTTDAARSRQ